MSRWMETFDLWYVMLGTSLFTALGIISVQALLRGNIYPSWQNAILCLVAGAVGFCIVALPFGRSLWASLSPRFLMIGIMSWILWFQQEPWLTLNDSALVRGSFEQEFRLQRFEQAGWFLFLIILPFVGLGIARWRGLQTTSTVRTAPPTREIKGSLVLLVALTIVAGFASRVVGTSPNGMVTQFQLLGVLMLGILFDLARRAASADKGVLVALLILIIGLPVVSFL